MSHLIDSISCDEIKCKNLQRDEEAAYNVELKAAIRKEEERSEEVRRLQREEFDWNKIRSSGNLQKSKCRE